MKAFLRLFALGFFLIAGTAAHAADPNAVGPLDQVLGKPDAPVTIVEYASLTCPHCAEFAETTLPQVKKDWIDTGKARLIYRDFPTAPAAMAVGAAVIDHCSGPARYFGVLDLLFRQQEKWVTAQDPLAEIKRIVRLAGMSGEDVDACLKRQDLANGIQARAQEAANSFGIDSTPSFLINGKLQVGAMSYDDMNAALNAAYTAAAEGRK